MTHTIPYSPAAIARDLRTIADRIENVQTLEAMVKCHDAIINLLIDMADWEATEANPEGQWSFSQKPRS